jgi:hypothetical protein
LPAESAVAARRFRSIPLSSVVSLLPLCTNLPVLPAAYCSAACYRPFAAYSDAGERGFCSTLR